MKDGRIEQARRMIEYLTNEITNSTSLLRILVRFNECSDKRKQKKLRSYYESVVSSKSKRSKVSHLKDIIKLIDKCDKERIDIFVDRDGISSELDLNIRDEYRERLKHVKYDMHYTINKNIKSLCSKIISDYERIDSYKDSIKEYEKEARNNKTKEKEEDEEVKTSYGIKTRFEDDDVPVKRSTTSHKEKTKRQTPSASSFEENTARGKFKASPSKEIDLSGLTEENMRDYIHNIDDILSNEPYKTFRDEIDETVENCLISKRFQKSGLPFVYSKLSPIDVLNYALNVYKTLPDYLEECHMIINSQSKEIFRKLNILNSLKEYERIYNKYMKVYSQMSKKNKELHNWSINGYGSKGIYELYFGKKDFSSPYGCMLSPEELRKAVNNKLIEDVSKCHF